MASVPRYVGTSVAEAKAYVRDALTSDVFLRVFDMDHDGDVAAASEDERAFVRAVCAAETEIDEKLAASHGAPFTGTVPDSVKQIAAERCLWCAVRLRPLMKDEAKAPYRMLYKDTDTRLKDIASDARARIPETGQPAPTSASAGVVSVDAPFWGNPDSPVQGF